MIDIYTLYRKAPAEARRPFNRFFESSGFLRAYEHLRYTESLEEPSIIKRSRGSVAAPATAFVHPLVAVEFVRWLDYGSFARMLAQELTNES